MSKNDVAGGIYLFNPLGEGLGCGPKRVCRSTS